MLLAQVTFNYGTGVVNLLALIPILLGLATWIIILVVIWRAMKAHESIAESLRQIADKEKI